MPPTFRRAALALVALLALSGCGSAAGGQGAPPPEPAAPRASEPPKPDEGIPLEPDRLAARLEATHGALGAAIDRWRAGGATGDRPPRPVTLYALYEQRIYLALTARHRLARAVTQRLHGQVAAEARDVLDARRRLSSLSTPVARRHFSTGPAEPARALRRYYRGADRRFGVSWQVLAAVNFVESAFGRLRNESTAGAQGPMQFIPSTWRAYGMGGDIHDPHDAILGAANYLHASGAPGDYRRALHAYNPSSAYVDAVLRYARRMRRSSDTFYALYSWQVFVNTPSGITRITGPGLH